jgi:tRNA A37 threonylcarbamoyladenosine modification protein TsaB
LTKSQFCGIIMSRGTGCADTKVDKGKQKLLRKIFQKLLKNPLTKLHKCDIIIVSRGEGTENS